MNPNKSIFSYVSSQFGKPRGLLGWLAGRIMATRPSNIERNDWTLSLLAIEPGDRILEIGFGPGIAIGKAAEAATEIVGVDHSAMMLRRATRHNRKLIEKGRIKLILGEVTTIDGGIGSFDKIYSVNVVQFWDNPILVFKQLRQLLKKNGKIITSYMPRHAGATDKDAFNKAEEIAAWLGQAGFSDIKIEKKVMKPVAAVAVVAKVD